MPEEPSISIALLIKNGMPELPILLASLRDQTGCGNFEIVAVDSGSTDGSLMAMRAADVRITQIAPETFRFGPTRQMAFELTRGQVIVTMSQDALPGGTGWLAAMTEPILNGQFDIIAASEIAPDSERMKLGVLNSVSVYQKWAEPYSLISCGGMAISRSAWLQTGFGNVAMSEDKYLGSLASQQKLRVGMCSDVPLLHGHSYTLMGHVKRCFNEGMGGRDTGGFYSIGSLLRDITRISRYRMALSAVLKYRRMSLFEASWYPLRPLFLYLGWKFGREYWR